jgi:phospholipid/cholesterol/gamma-HCH transport system substrate-binding protein
MKTGKTVEITVGAFVAAGLLALFFLSMQVSNLGTLDTSDTYEVTARFDNIGSLKVKAPVTMAGVELGRVSSIGFDQERYQAVVKLAIYKRFDKIPDDTYAKILTAGLLGEQYVGLDPGGSETYLQNGSEIEVTQSAMVLEDVIGQFIFGKAREESK